MTGSAIREPDGSSSRREFHPPALPEDSRFQSLYSGFVYVSSLAAHDAKNDRAAS